MRSSKLTVVLLLAVLLCLGGATIRAEAPLPADRWLEIDLYWFERGNTTKSCQEFWNRFAPLFEGVQGWRGVVLNVGWTVDYVVDWSGDLNQQIPFPVGLKQDSWFKVSGILSGTTAERVGQWKDRFAHPADRLKKDYEPWTYGDLKTLAETLRRVAEKEHGLTKMRVGALALGWKGIYQGRSPWAARHPEAFDGDFNGGSLLSAARLRADPALLAAFPGGLPQGTPFYELFGKQWGKLSRTAGLDAIVLRDSMLLQTQYGRGQLMRRPERARLLQEGAAGMVRETKKANPAALVLGYSNGASAMSDWRCNGVDMEAIFKEGCMDAWIDQTWAGAWNELGVRSGDFWNNPHLGWTYQLAYTLLHAAMLADTKVHHYPLVETFDAWESWDVIGTVPQRLKWGIWAYSHAAVKTPHGLKMPEGTYISWANQGTRLLDEQQVGFLAREINSAVRDAWATTKVCGPTLVYCRDAQAWQNAHAPDKDIKEWLDEQIGTLLKWPVPISSITRMEYLPKVKSDVFILGTPVHLQSNERQTLLDLIGQGQPMMLVGSPDGGVDPELLALAGIEPPGAAQAQKRTRAKLGHAGELTAGLPAEFEIIQQPFVPCKTNGDARVLYSVEDSPALTIRTAGNRKLVFWDPPDLAPAPSRPLIEDLGGVESYVLAARALNALLPGAGSPKAANIAPHEPVAILAWRGSDGFLTLLAGNLEEGLNIDAAKSRGVTTEQCQNNQVPAALDAYLKADRQLSLLWPAAPKTMEINLPAAGSVKVEY
jgi:hypothetical protein